MNSCSCLTLLLACVVYWQAKEISRVLKMGIPEGEDINFSLLEHVSPIDGKTSFFRPVCAQPGRHPLKPTLKGYFYTNLVGTLITQNSNVWRPRNSKPSPATLEMKVGNGLKSIRLRNIRTSAIIAESTRFTCR